MSAISREQGDIVLFRMNDIRDDVVQSIKQKALLLNKVIFPQWELTKLLNEGYSEFTSSVQKEYDKSPSAELAELLLPSFKTYFFSDRSLEGQVSQILEEKTH